MVERIFGIFGLFVGEILLPLVVSGLAIGDMSFQANLPLRESQVFRQRNTHLWYRSSIDAQRLRATAKLVVF